LGSGHRKAGTGISLQYYVLEGYASEHSGAKRYGKVTPQLGQ